MPIVMIMTDFSLLYQNVRGLRTKAEEVYASMIGSDFAVFALVETWLSDCHVNEVYFPDIFNIFRSDRDYQDYGPQRGGGVLMAVRNNIQCVRRFDLELMPEVVWLEFPRPGENSLLIGVHYFSQIVHHSVIEQYFTSLLDQIDCLRYEIIIVGDFNAPCVEWSTREFLPRIPYYAKCRAELIFNVVDYMNLEFCGIEAFPDRPCGSQLDLILSNHPVAVEYSQGVVPADAYHPPFFMSIKNLKYVSNQACRQSLDYRRGDYLSLYNDVAGADWANILLCDDLDEAVMGFQNIIKTAIEKNIPLTRKRPSGFPFWFSHELISLIRAKKRAHRLYRRTGLVSCYNRFSNIRRLVKYTLSRDRARYAKSCESDLTNRPDRFWKFISEHRSNGRNRVAAPLVNNEPVVDPGLLCDLFGAQFQSVFQEFREDKHLPVNMDVMRCAELDVPCVQLEDVICSINELNHKAAVGPDGIAPIIIKGISQVIAPILTTICRWSFASGCFPQLWKRSLVTPIPKPGPPAISNFRPISVLSSFSKIIEKIICKHIFNGISSKISVHQHGFIRGRSTSTNLSSFLDAIGGPVESRGQVDVIYFDYQKAFDKMPHYLLIQKLYNYGFSQQLVQWISSYITNRGFAVRFSGHTSDQRFLATSGVPQGSNLGPLLFVLFINDVTDVISTGFSLYADDLKIYHPIKTKSDHLFLQKNIDAVLAWSRKNHMPLNLNKIVQVPFSRKTNISYFSYNIDGVNIQRKTSVTDLGVLLDSKLYMANHVDVIVGKARRNLGLLKWLSRSFRNVGTCMTLYKALVRSQLEYCTTIWNRNRSITANCLEAVQKNFLSWLCFKFKLELDQLQNFIKLPSLSARREYFDLLFYYKHINGLLPAPGSINFRVPAGRLRGFSTIVVSTFTISPVNRCSIIANSKYNGLEFYQPLKQFIRELRDLC